MTTITLEGGKELKAALRLMGQDIQEAVGKAVLGTAIELRGDIVKRYNQGPATGRVYEKYNPRRTHQASAPGQAPMTDTGRLAGSVVFEVEGPLTASVSSAMALAQWLEYGTTRIAPRPAWVPAAEEMALKFRTRLERAIAGEIR